MTNQTRDQLVGQVAAAQAVLNTVVVELQLATDKLREKPELTPEDESVQEAMRAGYQAQIQCRMLLRAVGYINEKK